KAIQAVLQAEHEEWEMTHLILQPLMDEPTRRLTSRTVMHSSSSVTGSSTTPLDLEPSKRLYTLIVEQAKKQPDQNAAKELGHVSDVAAENQDLRGMEQVLSGLQTIDDDHRRLRAAHLLDTPVAELELQRCRNKLAEIEPNLPDQQFWKAAAEND